jgi:hypothetical protein
MKILLLFFSFTSIPCLAIEHYKPGDTLWVWAEKGLNIREKPDAFSKVTGKAPNGSCVLSLDYPQMDQAHSNANIHWSPKCSCTQ